MLRDHGGIFVVRIRIVQAREGRQHITSTANEVLDCYWEMKLKILDPEKFRKEMEPCRE